MHARSSRPGAPSLRRYISLLLLAAAIPLSCTAQAIQAVPGEEIPLGGTAPGSDVVYLFLAGPNLPPEGISLIDGTPVRTGDPESFTRVEVLTDGSWSYHWIAGLTGRVLDPGVYTVYAVLEPVARPDLGGADYAVQPVILGSTAAKPATVPSLGQGTLVISSIPDKATVSLDGRVAGTTPLTLTGVPSGSHTLVIAREGYLEYRQTVALPAGERGEISAALEPGSAVAQAPVSSTPLAPAPAKAAAGLLVPLGSAILAFLVLWRR